MPVRLGYACINTRLPSPNRTTRLNNATPERILELARHNLDALQAILRWNDAHDIRLFRISSETIPFGSHPVNDLPWWDILQPELTATADLIKASGSRISMHPGQFTVLNSLRPEVVEASVAELIYHTRFLDVLGVSSQNKIILHLGGVYGDKPASLKRFETNIQHLAPAIRRRLVIENDEKNYTLADALQVNAAAGVPVVLDVFHHQWNPSFAGANLPELVARAASTWDPQLDGVPKLHYSDQWKEKPPGSHSQSVDPGAFSAFYEQIRSAQFDVMLEVKDKEQSVLALYQRFPELRTPRP